MTLPQKPVSQLSYPDRSKALEVARSHLMTGECDLIEVSISHTVAGTLYATPDLQPGRRAQLMCFCVYR
jgi:hypothetical protein